MSISENGVRFRYRPFRHQPAMDAGGAEDAGSILGLRYTSLPNWHYSVAMSAYNKGMVEKLHSATDESGAMTYVVELLNNYCPGVTTRAWLTPACERLKETGNGLVDEITGRRYLLRD